MNQVLDSITRNPDPQVLATFEHFDPAAGAGRLPGIEVRTGLGLAHFSIWNDAYHFAALDLPALEELDPAIQVG
jgi:hypothetical protein